MQHEAFINKNTFKIQMMEQKIDEFMAQDAFKSVNNRYADVYQDIMKLREVIDLQIDKYETKVVKPEQFAEFLEEFEDIKLSQKK